MSTRQPDLLLLSGRPDSGKTQLARALGERLETPVFSREVVVSVCAESSDGALSAAQLETMSWSLFFRAMRAMATARAGAIGEADFSRERHKAGLEALRRETGMRIVEFHCTTAAEDAASRRDSAVWPTAIEVLTDALSPRKCEDYVLRRLEELRPQ